MAKITIVLEDVEDQNATKETQEGVLLGGLRMSSPELGDVLEEQSKMGAYSAAALAALTVTRKFELEVIQREIVVYARDFLNEMRMKALQKQAMAKAEESGQPTLSPANDELDG